MHGMRRTGFMGCLAALALASAGCGKRADPSARASQPSTPLYSQAAAGAVADSLLAAVPLPANTHRIPEPSSAGAKHLERPRNSEFLAKSVDRHSFWISTERPQAILALLAAKGPAPKLEYSGYGGVRGRTEEWSETLGVPTATPLAGPRALFVAIALAGAGRYVVRTDAVAAWHRRRPASSLVPSSARWMKVTVVEPAIHGFPGEPSRPRRTRSLVTAAPGTVQAVARAVNELPVAEAGGAAPSCPAMSVANTFGSPKVILVFRRTASGSNLARVITDSGYVCSRAGEATAKVTTRELPRGLLLTDHLNSVTLAQGASLADHIESALEHRLHLPAGF
ncbi:MAG: hypothetical protein QOI03_1838 [Solirubrobacteraceae bacterium]|jgi:hypothetical protein|nr:hypothetical protein [Solirubrobacteraceae bacterium]